MRDKAIPFLAAGLVALMLPAAYPTPALAQSAQLPFAYPKAGQNQEQMKKDQYDCMLWAQQQTGFDPSRPPPRVQATYAAPPPSYSGPMNIGSGEVGQGGMVSDAAKGAALGAIGGAIAGDAGKGAWIGAASSALFGGVRRSSRRNQEAQWRAQQEQQLRMQQQQLDQQWRQQHNAFSSAYAACMSGRNYTVK